MRSHAHAIVACDFLTTVTVRFRIFDVFVVLEVGTRRILHWNVTEHPSAEWTIQQFRTVITPETSHRFVLHDRDSIFASRVDRAIASMGRHVFKTPVRTPQAKRFLRTTDRHDASGVSGLANPHPRRTSPMDPSRMGDPL